MKYLKCVVWDLDNTLWDGVLLEDNNVKIKSGIKEILKTLDSWGILLSIASKNYYEDVMQQLKKFNIDQYFLYPQIGWNSKSESIKQIRDKLNIGMDTILFIDDQEYEREEVGFALPEVTIVNSIDYRQLLDMQSLKPKHITTDSSRRRQMYLEDQKRKKSEEDFEGASSEFLQSLNMKLIISSATEMDLLRAEELTVRTNQLNSTGIQYSYEELKELIHSNEYKVWMCELVDKFGSYGKVGLALVKVEVEAYVIKLLLMSCRVMSRGVGTVLLSFLMKEAKKTNNKLKAEFIRTDRNRQMLLTYRFANFMEIKQEENISILENDLSNIQEYPPFVYVTITNV